MLGKVKHRQGPKEFIVCRVHLEERNSQNNKIKQIFPGSCERTEKRLPILPGVGDCPRVLPRSGGMASYLSTAEKVRGDFC
jgi:hypothetical protein